MQNIVIVAEVQSNLRISIKERLKNMSYNIIEVPADTDIINGVREIISAIVIYADASLAQEQQALYYIKDRAVAEDIPIFLVGETGDLYDIKLIITKSLVLREFTRPINVHSLVEEIDHLLKKIGTQDKKKILVVDDSGAMLRVVKGWLEDKYIVFLANSGAMAIKYITLNRPDLILLDYDMPICDGKQVVEMIRAETEFADIPIIFLTHKDDTVSLMKVKQLNLEGYLLKSMEPAQIIQAVDDFFESRKGIKLEGGSHA